MVYKMGKKTPSGPGTFPVWHMVWRHYAILRGSMRGWSWLGRAGHSVTDGSAVQFPAATVLGQETDPSFATQQAWQRLSLRFTSQAPNLPQVGTELRNHSGRKKVCHSFLTNGSSTGSFDGEITKRQVRGGIRYDWEACAWSLIRWVLEGAWLDERKLSEKVLRRFVFFFLNHIEEKETLYPLSM